MSPDSGAEQPDVAESGGRKRRIIVFVAALFLLVAFGAVTTSGYFHVLFGGTGDLTVEVENQFGERVPSEKVEVIDSDTGEVVVEGTTDDFSKVTFQKVKYGEYDIRVADKLNRVTIDSDSQHVLVGIDSSPPNPNKT